MKRIVAYYRVSTREQGKSGLGLEGQRRAVKAYAESENATIVAEYREVESGKRKDRPQLAMALSHAKCGKASLVIAKLDRLARNVAFTAALMESHVDFVCCDNPHANKLTIHIMAAMAEDEADRISARTKAALAVASERGVLLGSHRRGHWKGHEDARLRGALLGGKASAAVHKEKADAAYRHVYAILRDLRNEGLSLGKIAERLNEQGQTTRNDKRWNASQVRRVLRRGETVAV